MMCCYKGEINLKEVDTGVGHYYESDFELVHTVKINKDSKLFDILESEEIVVNIFRYVFVKMELMKLVLLVMSDFKDTSKNMLYLSPVTFDFGAPADYYVNED